MSFWQDFMRRVNRANSNQMMATGQAEIEQRRIKIALMRKWINNASAYHRCRIGRITLKAQK